MVKNMGKLDKYEFVGDSRVSKQESAMIGEPLMVNPCSYEAVGEVFANVLDVCCVKRKWTIAGCDGSPYILGSRLIDSTFNCPTCTE